MKFYDICKYHLKPAINFAATDAWFVNQKALDKLPSNIRKIVISTLDEEFWLRTNQYEYLEERALDKIQKEQGVEVITLPAESCEKMQKAALAIWQDVAKKGPQCKKAVDALIEFNKSLGRLQ